MTFLSWLIMQFSQQNFHRHGQKHHQFPTSLVLRLLRLPKVKFVTVTLGSEGCVMLERTFDDQEDPQMKEVNVDSLLGTLKQMKDDSMTIMTCVSSPKAKLRAGGIGIAIARLILGTVERILSSELVDTTGGRDAFIGPILYGCSQLLRFGGSGQPSPTFGTTGGTSSELELSEVDIYSP